MDKKTLPAISTSGAAGLLAWMKRYQPFFYREVMIRMPKGLSGLGADMTTASGNTGGASASWTQTFQNILNTVSTAYLTKTQLDQQRKIMEMQLDRAKNGLSPLDINPQDYGIPGVRVGLSSDMKQWILYGAIGLGGLFLLSKKRRAR